MSYKNLLFVFEGGGARETKERRELDNWIVRGLMGVYSSRPQPTPTVQIMLVGWGVFAKLDVLPGDTVGRLVTRACAAFPSWACDASQITLCLVAAGGKEPSDAAVGLAVQRLCIASTLAEAGVVSGAWLVARRFVPSSGAVRVSAQDRAAVEAIARETTLAVAAQAAEDYERRRRSSAASLKSTRAQVVGGVPA